MEAKSALPPAYRCKDYDEYASILRPAVLRYRTAQMAATNDMYRKLDRLGFQFLTQEALMWFLEDEDSQFGVIVLLLMCTITLILKIFPTSSIGMLVAVPRMDIAAESAHELSRLDQASSIIRHPSPYDQII